MVLAERAGAAPVTDPELLGKFCRVIPIVMLVPLILGTKDLESDRSREMIWFIQCA